MKRFYLAGQQHFGNRGCEALVRGTASLLREQFGEVEILCPSLNIECDEQHWPAAAELGVRLVRAPEYPAAFRWWYRAVRLLPLLKRWYIPRNYHLPQDIMDQVSSCDCIILIGGDNFTLDYTPAGLVGNTAFVETFIDRGIPIVMWAASIGPFTREPVLEEYMATLLHKLPLITIRESVTEEYLRSIGVYRNVQKVADPAFHMAPEPFELQAMLPAHGKQGLVGINFSPLLSRFSRSDNSADDLRIDLKQFITEIIERGYGVLMVPHVDPLDGTGVNSDTAFMTPLMALMEEQSDSLAILPNDLNAAQLKYAISKCKYFVGARTHSTIAALSSGVPTISIAYSSKAIGLNRDIFGDERFVLHASDLSSESLVGKFQLLVHEEEAIRVQLRELLPVLQRQARELGKWCANVLE